ncbi:MAG TPA: AAA family ATPase [Polyangiaceae bacterium]|nr:AAA family ATPase [Polyangiaceae bacterium]
MAGLEFRFLGDFEVRKDGRALDLPPSKKTRALLAYLSLQSRQFRREQLCQLLWEIPDDPRGSLRWSLSKLRRLVDEGERTRVLSDRDRVSFDAEGISIDTRELKQLVAGGLRDVPNDVLVNAAARYRGNLLEGLEFSSFHSFHAWCVAEREQALRDQAALLTELVARFESEPERAIPFARALVGLSPYEEGQRATLIRLLNAARQFGEAEEQYQLGLRMLQEIGTRSSGALLAARRPPRFDAPPLREPVAQVIENAPVSALTRGLFGREQLTTQLTEALAEVSEKQRASVRLLSGAPGVGKTRLLDVAASLARSRDALVLRTAAFEADTIRPFALWIDALRGLDPALAEQTFADSDSGNRDRLFSKLSDFVASESEKRPVVLLFDDVQWCDESSAAALHYVARINRARPFFAVLAARDGELRDNAPVQQTLRSLRRDLPLIELEIGPLSREALVRIIDERAPGADSARLSLECGGNPLLAIELAHAEMRGSAAGSLDDLVRERLARFGVVTAEVLRWAAVLGPRIDIGTLAKVSGVDRADVDTALEQAEKQAILQTTERGSSFAHALIARAVYNEISPLRRQVMHRRIAELLQKDSAQELSRAADLAHHATLSGDPGLAARAMVSAGRLCLRFFANDDALSLAGKGLQLVALLPDSERVCAEIDLHDILLAAGPLADRESAARSYAALAERALDHGALGHARLGYHMAAVVRWTQGHWKAAREQSLQAARVVRGGQHEAQIIGMAETAKCLVMIERDISRADAMLMEASALAERSGFTHHAIAAGLGMLRFHENRLDEAEECFREARALCKSAGDRLSEFQANEYLIMVDLQRGRLAEARERCHELVALADKLREGSEEPFARAIAGLCNYAIDDDDSGLHTALADLRVADAKHRLAYILTRAALIDSERGRSAVATERATEALGYAKILERATEMLLANAVLSHEHSALGDDARAAGHRREVERIRVDGASVWTHTIAEKLSTNPPATVAREAP